MNDAPVNIHAQLFICTLRWLEVDISVFLAAQPLSPLRVCRECPAVTVMGGRGLSQYKGFFICLSVYLFVSFSEMFLIIFLPYLGGINQQIMNERTGR